MARQTLVAASLPPVSQTYTGAVTLSADVSLITTNSNVYFGSTIKGSTNNENLIINAGTGDITFNDTVGSNANNYNLDNNATVTQLTGGDAGEGGDFLGTFTHAANFGGVTKTVGNVTFTRHTAANSDATGVTIYSVNEIQKVVGVLLIMDHLLMITILKMLWNPFVGL